MWVSVSVRRNWQKLIKLLSFYLTRKRNFQKLPLLNRLIYITMDLIYTKPGRQRNQQKDARIVKSFPHSPEKLFPMVFVCIRGIAVVDLDSISGKNFANISFRVKRKQFSKICLLLFTFYLISTLYNIFLFRNIGKLFNYQQKNIRQIKITAKRTWKIWKAFFLFKL